MLLLWHHDTLYIIMGFYYYNNGNIYNRKVKIYSARTTNGELRKGVGNIQRQNFYIIEMLKYTHRWRCLD